MLKKWREKVEFGFVPASNYDELWNEITRVCHEISQKYLPTVMNCINEVRRTLAILRKLNLNITIKIPEDIRKWLTNRIIEYVSSIVFFDTSEKEALEKAKQAANSAAHTLFRDMYEIWFFLNICFLLAPISSSVSVIRIHRKGLQLKKKIPPNCWFEINFKYVNLFLEAPRYISWDTYDEFLIAQKIKRAPRPDIMIYITEQPLEDILDESRDPPIKPPNGIIEIKCFNGWWKKSAVKNQIKKYMRLCKNIVIASRVDAPTEFYGVKVFPNIDFNVDNLGKLIKHVFNNLGVFHEQ